MNNSLPKIGEDDIEAILITGDMFASAEDIKANEIFTVEKASAEEKILRLERAVNEHQAFQFIEDGHLDWMDVQSANIIVKVFNLLKEDRKQKFVSMPYVDMARIAWRCIA